MTITELRNGYTELRMAIRSSVRSITELRNEHTEFIFLIRTITRLRNIIIYLSKPATNCFSSKNDNYSALP